MFILFTNRNRWIWYNNELITLIRQYLYWSRCFDIASCPSLCMCCESSCSEGVRGFAGLR